MRLLIVKVCILAPVIACGGSDATPSWTASRDSIGFRLISGAETACTSCIRVNHVVTLGTDSAQGFLEDNGSIDYVVQDRTARYWVGQRTTIKVFASDGRFLRTVGRRGQGPLEFELAQPLWVDSVGMVHVVDPRLGRETVIGPDFARQSDRTIPVAFDAVAPLPGEGHRYVISKWATTPEQLGLPLHIISGSEILTSFGLGPQPSGTSEVTRTGSPRLVTTSPAGHIFAANISEYQIEVFTDSGLRTAGFELPNLNTEAGRPGPWALDNPPRNLVSDIAVHDAHRLWVVTRHRRPNWRDFVVERLSADGVPYLEPKDREIASVFRSRVDLLDLNRSAIAAGTWFDGWLLRFVEPGVVLGLSYDKNGAPLLNVLQLDVDLP
jgi:hypothetical protein